MATTANRLKDKKITIYQKAVTYDADGYQTSGYTPIHSGTLWAYVRQVSQNEVFKYNSIVGQESMIFAINWRDDITIKSNYIYYNGKMYDIKRIDSFEGYRNTLTITADVMERQPAADTLLPYSG